VEVATALGGSFKLVRLTPSIPADCIPIPTKSHASHLHPFPQTAYLFLPYLMHPISIHSHRLHPYSYHISCIPSPSIPADCIPIPTISHASHLHPFPQTTSLFLPYLTHPISIHSRRLHTYSYQISRISSPSIPADYIPIPTISHASHLHPFP